MTRQKTHVTVVAGLIAPGLILLLAVLPNRNGQTVLRAANPSPVLVTNGNSQPVPTAAQGTTSVSGNVGISGVPTVSVNGAVQVGNSSNSPVPVINVDEPGRNAVVWFDLSCNFSAGPCLTNSYQVPPGHRLVIEAITGAATLPVGQKIFAEVFVSTNPTTAFIARHTLTAFPQGSFSGIDYFSISQPVRMYADAGEYVVASGARSANTGVGSFSAGATGFLIDCSVGAGCPTP